MILARRESCVWVVKNEIYKQKVEISRELCVGGEIRTLDRNTERAAPPLKGPPLFFKDTYYIAPR
jgi:hypothetical protein